jgi:hypothetical protein
MLNKSWGSRNITPRRSKALPVVEHPKLWKCILISKEANHGRWSLFWGWNNIKKERSWRISQQEKSIDAVKRELGEELWNQLSVKKAEDFWTILTDKSWRLVSKSERKKIKQRIFALLVEWKTQKDDLEIESIGYYPLEDRHSNIRKELRKNMDEFAAKALIDYRKKLLSPSYESWNIDVPRWQRQAFDIFLQELRSNRWIIWRILNW